MGVHPGLDHLEGDHAREGAGLLGHPDRAEAALTDLLTQGVGADLVALGLGEGRIEGLCRDGHALIISEEGVRLLGLHEEALDLEPELGVAPAGPGQEMPPGPVRSARGPARRGPWRQISSAFQENTRGRDEKRTI